ncbi:hypothetical protein CCACVL1_07647 [Corchorus capsularis]|uniref:Uncharacterized protein n=1 Tax=Corchorus capsularis TaxID=210143 RepID=A0A1R3J4L2_COCAP|nr:hypothetical protein CCACVL1_07647 [Corchorus capsularis]
MGYSVDLQMRELLVARFEEWVRKCKIF